MSVLNSRSGWQQVEITLRGWVLGKFVEGGQVTARGGVNLRGSIGVDGQKLVVIPYDTQVEVRKNKDGWKLIDVSFYGWVHESALGKSSGGGGGARPGRKINWGRFAFSSSVFYRVSQGTTEGNIEGQPLKSFVINMGSMLGGGVVVNLDHNFGHQIRYTLAFDYYMYSKIDGLEMPSAYYGTFGISYRNLFKVISPFVAISYEKLASVGQMYVSGQWTSVAFFINSMWAEAGVAVDIRLSNSLKFTLLPSYSLSLSASAGPEKYSLSGSISGMKVKGLGELVYKNKYSLGGGVIYNLLQGDSDITNTEFILKVGMLF